MLADVHCADCKSGLKQLDTSHACGKMYMVLTEHMLCIQQDMPSATHLQRQVCTLL